MRRSLCTSRMGSGNSDCNSVASSSSSSSNGDSSSNSSHISHSPLHLGFFGSKVQRRGHGYLGHLGYLGYRGVTTAEDSTHITGIELLPPHTPGGHQSPDHHPCSYPSHHPQEHAVQQLGHAAGDSSSTKTGNRALSECMRVYERALFLCVWVILTSLLPFSTNPIYCRHGFGLESCFQT